MRGKKELLGILAIRISVLFVLVSLFAVLIFIGLNGLKVLNIGFLFEPPK